MQEVDITINDDERITAPLGISVRDGFMSYGKHLLSVCGGKGKCGKCKIIVKEGKVNELTESEKKLLDSDEIKDGYRLACQIIVLGNLKVEIPKESLLLLQRLQTEGEEVEIQAEPLIKKLHLTIEAPSLLDPRPDFTRLKDTLSTKGINASASFDMLKKIPDGLRKASWSPTVTLHENEIIDIRPLDSMEKLGIAFDIGSTKLAAYLVDLDSGKTIDALGLENPQAAYGDDIISRITYALKGEEYEEELRKSVITAMNTMINSLCTKNGHSNKDIAEISIVGNTAMHHLLLGLPLKQLAFSPYIPAFKDAIDIKAKCLGIYIMDEAYVHLPPLIGGYVGSDHVAVLLATRLWKGRKDRLRIAIDIGTNTEIGFSKGDISSMASLSCASGPAFEGGGIKHGIKAMSGAIDKVFLEGSEVRYSTIDNKPPIGICGSGILDAVFALFDAGIINERGRLDKNNVRARMSGEVPEFVLVSRENSGIGRDIVVTQNDITAILLAKGAIRAGLSIGLEKLGVSEKDIDEVLVAGAFGSYINIKSAVGIDMLPKVELKKIRQVGNAAGIGAKLALISNVERDLGNLIAENVSYVETASYPNFPRIISKSMYLPKLQYQS